MDADDALDARARALGEPINARLGGEPEGVHRSFAFLATQALVKAGAYTLLFRGERDGRRVLIAMDPYNERAYEVLDPEYGEAEPVLVDAMARTLGLLPPSSPDPVDPRASPC
jgi:hypothetical protein